MIAQKNKLNVKMKTDYWLLRDIINIYLFNQVTIILKKIKINTFIKKRNNEKILSLRKTFEYIYKKKLINFTIQKIKYIYKQK